MIGVGFGGGLEFSEVFDFDEEAPGSVEGSGEHGIY
jgi:hypothetical protein